MEASRLNFRTAVLLADKGNVREIVESTGFFHPAEMDVAVELVAERLEKGSDSGYEFIFAEKDGLIAGYTCFGPIPCTASSFDLYWIAVHKKFQASGVGRQLLKRAEAAIAGQKGSAIYVETSSRAQYGSTRRFYERNGYGVEAVVKNFYAPEDDKVIYVKRLACP